MSGGVRRMSAQQRGRGDGRDAEGDSAQEFPPGAEAASLSVSRAGVLGRGVVCFVHGGLLDGVSLAGPRERYLPASAFFSGMTALTQARAFSVRGKPMQGRSWARASMRSSLLLPTLTLPCTCART